MSYTWDDAPSGSFQHSLQRQDDREQTGVALRKAMLAMTSGIYQRRALGFKSHFAFGTVFSPTTSLDVYAATWISSEDDATGTEAVASLQGILGLTSGPTNQENLGSDGVKPSRDDRIVLYHLKSFEIRSPVEMLRYYLLMRAAQKLAL
ncbi:hypothetical protein FRC11_012586, partial [Ceratobasidium sp. 423]